MNLGLSIQPPPLAIQQTSKMESNNIFDLSSENSQKLHSNCTALCLVNEQRSPVPPALFLHFLLMYQYKAKLLKTEWVFFRNTDVRYLAIGLLGNVWIKITNPFIRNNFQCMYASLNVLNNLE